MLLNKDCVEKWLRIKEIIKVGMNKHNRPDYTAKEIVDEIGMDDALEVFATVAWIKKHDGRIYGLNRDFMNSIEINTLNAAWNHENNMMSTGLDDIHTAHLDQIITYLRKMAKEEGRVW